MRIFAKKKRKNVYVKIEAMLRLEIYMILYG